MAEGTGKANEIEPCFDIEDLMLDFLPDDSVGATNIGMEKVGMLGPSSNVNNLNQDNKLVNLERCQVAATKSELVSPISRHWKPVDSASDNLVNRIAPSLQRSTLASTYADFSGSQIPSGVVSQSQQHQLHIQTAQRQNIQPLSAQLSMYHNNQRQQLPVEKQNTGFGLLPQQQNIGYPSTIKHQELLDAFKHSGQMTSDKTLQQISKPMQMGQSLETLSDVGSNGLQLNLLTSVFARSQNPIIVDQQKPVEQHQTAIFGLLLSLESTAQLILANSGNWVDPVIQQIQFMNNIYFTEVLKAYKRACESRQQAANAELVARCERNKDVLGKIAQFLQMPKSELVKYPKRIVCEHICEIVRSLKRIMTGNPVTLHHSQQVKASGSPSRAPSLQQKRNIFQFNQGNMFPDNTHTCLPQSMMHHGNLNSQGSSINPFQVGPSTGMQKSDPSSLINSLEYNQMKSGQHYSPSRAQQGLLLSRKGSQIIFDHRAPCSLPRSFGISQQNTTLSSPQQIGSSSPRNSFSSLDFTIRPLAQNTIVTGSQHNRRQDHHLTMQNKLKQPMQQILSERNKQQMAQKMNEDAKMAQSARFNQRMLGTHHSTGQHLENYPLSLLQSSSTSYRVASPQSSQHSSTQLELKDLSSKLSRSTTPLLSTASPSAVPSPVTPVTPSSVPTDQEKIPSWFNSLPVKESNKVTTAPADSFLLEPQSMSKSQVHVSVTHKPPKSPLLKESTCPGDYPQSHAKSDPVQRMVEVVKSMSQKALRASVRDIDAVTCIIDKKPGSFLQGGSRWVIGQDLADDSNSCQPGNRNLLCETDTNTGMKREMSATSTDDMTSAFYGSNSFESGRKFLMEFNETSRRKRIKKEPNDLLLEEIREINHMLIETVVDVIEVKDVPQAGSAEGTIIRCLYNAVQCNRKIKMPKSSPQMFSNLLVELLVTSDYPNSSPIVLERSPLGCSEADELKVLWTKAKSNFSLLLRKFSEPISLKEMAKTWDICAREVFRECVQKFGGGDFSSTYGKWENCIVAT